MRYSLLVWLISCVSIFSLQGQQDSLVVHDGAAVMGMFSHMAVDPLGQIILANVAGDVLKYDKKGQLQFTYSNARLGELGHIDASNPFNLLLYYPEFQTILLLDRTLGERARLDLRLHDLAYVSTVARSTMDELWVYDDWAFQLKQIDGEGEVTLHTNDLRQQLGVETAADQIIVDKDWVYVHFPGFGLAVFNNFGQFIERIELQKNEKLLQAQEGRLLLKNDQQFFRLQPKNQNRALLHVPNTDGRLPQLVYKQGQQFFVLYPHAFKFANLKSGVVKQKIAQRDLSEMHTIYELIAGNPACEVLSFTMGHIKAKQKSDVKLLISKESVFDERIKAMLTGAESGDLIYLESIKSASDCLKYQHMGKTSFVFEVQ